MQPVKSEDSAWAQRWLSGKAKIVNGAEGNEKGTGHRASIHTCGPMRVRSFPVGGYNHLQILSCMCGLE